MDSRGDDQAELATLGRNVRLFGVFAGARIRGEWQYRVSFVTFTIAQALISALELAALLILFQVTPSLGDWSRAEVLLLYGLATVPFALSDLLISAVEEVSVAVRDGSFDRMLLRPVSTLVQLTGDQFELRRIGRLAPGVGTLGWALITLDLDWTPVRVAAIVVALAAGFVVYSALWIATAATTFWIVDSREALNAVTYGGQFANEYPMHIYGRWLRLAIGWVIPLAFVAYVPVIALVDAPNPLGIPPWLAWTAPAVAMVALGCALWVWHRGIEHYQSTGS